MFGSVWRHTENQYTRYQKKEKKNPPLILGPLIQLWDEFSSLGQDFTCTVEDKPCDRGTAVVVQDTVDVSTHPEFLKSKFPPPVILAQAVASMLPAPQAIVCAKVSPCYRKVCFMDADDFVALKTSCAKLYKKSGIFYTKYLIWDPCFSSYIGLNAVTLKWFSCDYQSKFDDTRIMVDGKLVKWCRAVSG